MRTNPFCLSHEQCGIWEQKLVHLLHQRLRLIQDILLVVSHLAKHDNIQGIC